MEWKHDNQPGVSPLSKNPRDISKPTGCQIYSRDVKKLYKDLSHFTDITLWFSWRKETRKWHAHFCHSSGGGMQTVASRPPLGLNNCSSWQPTAPAATHYVRQTPCYRRFLGRIEMHSDNTSKIASSSPIHEFCWVHNSTHQEAKNAMLRFLRFFWWYGLN